MTRTAMIALGMLLTGCQAVRQREAASDSALEAFAAAAINTRTEFDVIGHNVANFQTVGFKASRIIRTELPPARRAIAGSPDAGASANAGRGMQIAGTRLDMSQGSHLFTGRNLDVLVDGAGFLCVLESDGQGGCVYTRAGALHLNADRELQVGPGLAITPTLVLPPDASSVTITSSGEVFVLVSGSAEPQCVGQLQLTLFADPESLKPIGNCCYVETANSGPPQRATPGLDGAGSIRQGFLEQSNVILEREKLELARIEAALRTLRSVADAPGPLAGR